MGRPRLYTPELADEICTRLSEGETLTSICAPDGMPSMGAVWHWTHDVEGFAERYARARELQGHAAADNAIAAAKKRSGDTQADRLEFDALRWFAGKVAPRHYGDKVDHTLAAPDGGPVVFRWED